MNTDTRETPEGKTMIFCELCGKTEAVLLYPALHKIYRCRRCKLVFYYPQPKLDFLRDLYGQSYFASDSSSLQGYDNYLRDEKNIKQSFEKRFRYIDRFYNKPGKVLDIGCAAGFFLDTAKQRGWETAGVEISKFAAGYCRDRGLDVFCGVLDEYQAAAGSFDLVSMWDVIEHVLSPVKELKKAGQYLRPGGHVILTTPLINSWSRVFFREKWMGFKDEEHLYFFSSKTLNRLLETAGFEVVFSKFEGKYISLDFFKRRIGCYSKGLSQMLRRVLPRKHGAHINFYINPFDIGLVIARKK